MSWVLVAVVVLAFVLNVVAPWLLSRVAIPFFEADAQLHARAAKPDPAAELSECRTADGLRLSLATWNRPSDGDAAAAPVVVFCPEAGGSKWTAAHYAAGLIADGVIVVSLDHRNVGESDTLPGYRPRHWLSDHEVNDVRAVVAAISADRLLKSRDIVLFGISRGGCAAMYAASLDRTVHGVVADGVFPVRKLLMSYLDKWGTLKFPPWMMRAVPDWHLQLTLDFARMASGRRHGCRYLDLSGVLGRLRGRPFFLIAGKRDSYIPLELTELVARQAGGGPEDVWAVPKAKHNHARESDPATYDRRVRDFVRTVTGWRGRVNDRSGQARPATEVRPLKAADSGATSLSRVV